MNIRFTQAKSILTPQTRGFLTAGERPYTHSLSWAAGCGYGKLYCGAFCYAQMLPNWHFARRPGEEWGDALIVKENAPELLDAQLSRARSRLAMRIFMSPVTDPYQPIERKLRLTRRCLEVFARYDELDLLLIQTRGPAVLEDLGLIARIPYAWLGMTIETDRHDLPYGPSKALVERRLAAVKGLWSAASRRRSPFRPACRIRRISPGGCSIPARSASSSTPSPSAMAAAAGARATAPSRRWRTTTGATIASPCACMSS